MSHYMMVTDNNILVITIYVISKSISGVMIYKNKNISSTISEDNDHKHFFGIHSYLQDEKDLFNLQNSHNNHKDIHVNPIFFITN